MEAIRDAPAGATARWRFALKQAGTHSLLIWPPLTIAWLFFVGLRRHALSVDFAHAYLPAARAVLAGNSPYPPVSTVAVFPRTAFVYPPLTAFLATPFTVMPSIVVEVLVSLLAIVGVVAILWLLGVRDWRCYMIPFLWVPTYSAIQIGNVTVLAALGLALVWRYRNHWVAVAVISGFLIALKLFFWPLLVWLIATRRFRAGGAAAVATPIFLFAPWAAIDFAGLKGYPHLLSVLSQAERQDQYTVSALLARGVSWRVAEVAGAALGLAVLALAVRWAQRRDDRGSFALTLAAVLLLSPLVEMHYFLLLLVILALYAPRLSWPWVTPILLWVGPQIGHRADWRTAAVLAVAAATVAFVLRRASRTVASPAGAP